MEHDSLLTKVISLSGLLIIEGNDIVAARIAIPVNLSVEVIDEIIDAIIPYHVSLSIRMIKLDMR